MGHDPLRVLTALAVSSLLFNLKSLNDGGELAENLVGLLMVLDLGGNELRKVAEGLGGVEHLLTRCEQGTQEQQKAKKTWRKMLGYYLRSS